MKYASPLLLITVLAAPAVLAQSNSSTPAAKPKAAPKQGAAVAVSKRKTPDGKDTEKKGTDKKGPEKKTAAGVRNSSTAKTTTVARKNAVSTKAGSSNTSSARKTRTAKRPSATAARYRQLAPTPERYKEIQQALADKGYLKSEPNGVWDAESQDALRQFQTDKNLPPTGKLTAASLIGLGLGPQTAGGSNADPPAVPTAKPPAGDPPAGGPPAVPPPPTPEAASPPKPAN